MLAFNKGNEFKSVVERAKEKPEQIIPEIIYKMIMAIHLFLTMIILNQRVII